MGDIFYFMEICDLFNYADDNTLSVIEKTVQMVLGGSKNDAENAMNLFKDTFIHTNPEKNLIYFIKKYTSKLICPKFIEINDTEIKCEKEVKPLGITIDEKVMSDKHINNLGKSAARQKNVIYQFKGIFDVKESESIYNTFILSNFNYCFNYCPTIWHYCGKVYSKTIEKNSRKCFKVYIERSNKYIWTITGKV